MSKIIQNKLQKRTALLDSAYELFTSVGFTSTTIRDIADRAGVAKGTFYLYFRDKTDIRNALIRAKASRLLRDACARMDDEFSCKSAHMDTADKFVFIIDYIIDYVAGDVFFTRFISKHLSWGLFAGSHRSPKTFYGIEDENDGSMDFEEYISNMLKNDGVEIRDLRLLLFTLLELVSSACYDLIMYKEPVTIEEFKPHLNHTIRLLVNDTIVC